MSDSFNFNKSNLDQALMRIATQMRINPETRFVINISKTSPNSNPGFKKYSSSKGFEDRSSFRKQSSAYSEDHKSYTSSAKSDRSGTGYTKAPYRKSSKPYTSLDDGFGPRRSSPSASRGSVATKSFAGKKSGFKKR